MPWEKRPMKDVVVCDKLRGADKRALIRRFPNGETHDDEVVVLHCCNAIEREPAELKHLSKRRKRKRIVIPLVVASEEGRA